jgi:hypothetical protein
MLINSSFNTPSPRLGSTAKALHSSAVPREANSRHPSGFSALCPTFSRILPESYLLFITCRLDRGWGTNLYDIMVDLHPRVHAVQLLQDPRILLDVSDLGSGFPSRVMHRDGMARSRWDGITLRGLDLRGHGGYVSGVNAQIPGVADEDVEYIIYN